MNPTIKGKTLRVIHTEYSEWLLATFRRFCGVWIASIGFTLMLLGDGRLTSPVYHSMREVAAWFHISPSIFWGSLAFIFGVMVLIRPTRLFGLCMSSIWMGCYCLGFWISVANSATSPTGAINYSFVTMLFIAAWVLERQK